MTDLLNRFKSNRTSGSKSKYELGEKLLIMKLSNEGYSVQEISDVIGRTGNSVNYMIYRVLKPLDSIEQLFKQHNVVFKDEDQINDLIEKFQNSLDRKLSKVS